MIINKKEIQEKISRHGLKVTHQRMVIYAAVAEMKHHPTADHIYEAIHDENPSISLGTVYKTLDSFVDKGILKKVFTQNGQMRYDARTENHGHIYCTNTDDIIDYFDEELNEIIIRFFRKKRVNNLMIKNITLQINANRIDPDKDISIK
ncbi:MAG: transcriptional repressor [Cyclobacteriaceae bacterium]